MTQGDLGAVTFYHWQVALQTGAGAGLLAVLLSLGNLRDLATTRFGVAAIAVLGTFIADYLTHSTHFGSAYTEAIVTAMAAGGLSLVLSLTPIDKVIRKLQ